VNCQIAQNNLSAYLDRELPGDAMIAVRRHVEQCDECQRELESIRRVKASLSALPVMEPSAQFAQRMTSLVSGGATPTPRLPFGVVLATSVAAAVLAVVVFNIFLSGGRGSIEEGSRFDAASDSALTEPDFGGHAPLIPVGR
jgi:anti-sigma factor RsiW